MLLIDGQWYQEQANQMYRIGIIRNIGRMGKTTAILGV